MNKASNKKVSALVLLSGGLDSMLAARLLLEQGAAVTGLTFTSYFFGAARARRAADQLGIEMIEYDFKEEHLAMAKKPAHGYGSNMNPCIDCHGLMLVKAREILKKEGYNLVATGEVLGQRPMSQNPAALAQVEKISGLAGRLLRPLSAKLLPLTEPEKEGKIEREKLLDISGRSRRRQMKLAANFSLKDYPSPAGGCLLTDPSFSQRLKKLFEFWPDCAGADVELLKCGRVYWFGEKNEKMLVVIGRNQEDNERLAGLARTGDAILELAEEMGPTTLLRNYQLPITNFQLNPKSKIQNLKFFEVKIPHEINEDMIRDKNLLEATAMLTGYYVPKMRGKKVKINVNIK